MGSGTTFADLLVSRSHHFEDAFTFSKSGEIIDRRSYASLHAQASRIAHAIHEVTRPGDRAILLFPPGLGFVDAFFACIYAGVIPTPLSLGLNKRQVEKLGGLFHDAKPTIVLGPADLRTRLPFIHEFPEISWIDPETLSPGPTLAPNPIEIALLQYTSGSTSAPKGVIVSHANLLANEAMIAESFGHTPDTVGGGWLPLYHDMGLIGCMLQPVFVGFTVHLISHLEFLAQPFRWLELVSKHRINTTGGPNFAYETCVQRVSPERDGELDLRSWTIAFNGAEPVSARTLDAFTDRFSPRGFDRRAFFPCYGLAEATLLVCGGPRGGVTRLSVDRCALDAGEVVPAEVGPKARELVASGAPTRESTVKIVDPARAEEVSGAQPGEIWVAGPSVVRGYLHGRAAQTFQGTLYGQTYLRTGDLGFLHDGQLFVTGRMRDMIIVSGKNHYAEDIEATIRGCDPVFEGMGSAAFATQEASGETLVVLHEIGRDDRSRIGEAELAEIAREAVSDHHGLRLGRFVVVLPSSLPRTSSGKVQRFVARQQFLAQDLKGYPSGESHRCAP